MLGIPVVEWAELVGSVGSVSRPSSLRADPIDEAAEPGLMIGWLSLLQVPHVSGPSSVVTLPTLRLCGGDAKEWRRKGLGQRLAEAGLARPCETLEK